MTCPRMSIPCADEIPTALETKILYYWDIYCDYLPTPNISRPQATALIVLPFVLDPRLGSGWCVLCCLFDICGYACRDPQDVHSVVVAGFSDGYVRIYSKVCIYNQIVYR